MISKKIIFLSCVLLIFLSIGNISAIDVNNTVQSSNVNLNEVITSNEINEQDVLSISDENDLYANSFNELQDLVDNAQGTLDLNDNYYSTESFVYGVKISKDITINGHGHSLNANFVRIFSIEKDGISVVLKDINFNGGWGFGGGGAILNTYEHTYLTIINCNFDSNSVPATWSGGAIYCAGDLLVNNSFFSNNSAFSNGGAIYCTGNLLVNNSFFSNNYAFSDGGAIYCKKVCSIYNSNFENNYGENNGLSAIYGGAVYSNRIYTVNNCTFYNNKAKSGPLALKNDKGGAIYISDKCNPEFVSCRFEKNSCEDGGAIYLNSKESNLKLTDCSFIENTAKYGGAVYSNGEIEIKHNNFSANSAREGGAIYANALNGKVSDSLFSENKANPGGGGAVYLYGNCNLNFVSCSFENNKCTADGGAIYLNSANSELKLSDCSFSSNSAYVDGGAIYNYGSSIISNSKFVGNAATGATVKRSFGGAILSKGLIRIEKSTFEKNNAYNLGGAVYAVNIKIKGSTFMSNSAKDGGAVYIHQDGENKFNFEFVSCRFENNKCTDDGGAIYISSMDSHLKLSYCTFVDNKAENKGKSVYNRGYYDLVDMCWFGENNPNFENLLKEGHWYGDEDHKPSNYLKIAMEINEKDLYVGNPYKTTVYFHDLNGNRLNNDLLHSMGSFYGDGIFKELKNDGLNDMIAEVVFSDNNPTIHGKIDHQVVDLTLTAKNKEKSEVQIINCGDVTYPDNVVVDYKITNMANNASYVVKKSGGTIVKQGSFANPDGQIIIENLDSGSYSVTITNPETYNTLSSNATANFNVLKAYVSVNISVDDVVYGTPSNIRINSNVDGEYSVNVNGSLFTISVINGVGNKSVEFNAGVYYANVSMDNKNYYGNANTTFSVLKADIGLFIRIYDEVYPHDVNGIVYSSVDGEYNLTVGLYQSSIVVVKNNVAYINLGVLDAGTYEAIISFAGDENYNPTSSKTTFDVNASGTFFEIEINASKIIYGETATVTHNISDGATGTIKYYLNNVTLLDELSVGENLTLPILDAGNYIIVANYSGDINFKSSVDYLSFTVNPALNNVVLNVSDVTYGDDTLFEVSADVDGNYTVNINGTNIIVNVLNGKGNKTIALDAGRYNANVTFNNKNYNTKSRNATFNVFKADIDLIIEVYDKIYPQDVECVVFASRDGEYNLTIASYSAVITVNNNLAYVNIGVLDAGTYVVFVSFAGDNNYNSALANTTFDVYPSATLFEVEVNPGEISYGETATVTHNLSDGATGTIKYYLSNGTFIDELSVGEDLILPILDAGSYVVIANYSGDNNFLPAFDSTFITVNPAPNRVNVSATNVTYGENTTIEVSADVDGIYQLDVNGIIYDVSVNNGFGSKIISLNAGSYYANASFADSNYNTVSKNANFNVYKAVNNLDIVIFDTVYPNDVSGVIYAEADGEYKLTVGEYSTTVVVKNGKSEFNAGILDAGEYLVVVNYPGDLNYEANSYSTNVTVSKFIPNINLQVNDFDYGDVGVITITSDIPGSVNVTVNGITEILDLNEQSKDLLMANMNNILKGEYQATLRLNNMNAGSYPVTVVYNGDENIESIELSADFNVNALNVTMDINATDINVGDDEVITVILSSDVNGTVTVVVDDMNYTASVSDGKAVITIPGLSAGYKNADVYYSGDANYNPLLGNVSFAVNKIKADMSVESNTPVSGENIHIVVYLPADATGTVTLALEGKNYTASVKDGKAVFDIPGLAAGKYNITAYYSGDANYNPLLGNVSFAVNKIKADMSVESNTPISGETIHVVVYLPSDATETVTLALEGKYYTASVKDGKAVFDIPGLAAGKYNITAYYSGDNKYDPAQIDSIITVNDNSTKEKNQTEPQNKLSSKSDMAVKATDNAAGNPILMLLLTLMAIGFTGIRRFKK